MAKAYTEVMGGSISSLSVRRILRESGKRLAVEKGREAKGAMAIGPLEESPRQRQMALKPLSWG